MKTTIKSIAILIVVFFFSAEVSAQKISAAAISDQHYAMETSNYKLMMICLAAVYGIYLLMHNYRRREISQFMGKTNNN